MLSACSRRDFHVPPSRTILKFVDTSICNLLMLLTTFAIINNEFKQGRADTSNMLVLMCPLHMFKRKGFMARSLFIMVFLISLGLSTLCFGDNSDFYGDYIFTIETGDPVCEQSVGIHTIGNTVNNLSETYIYLPLTELTYAYTYVSLDGYHVAVTTAISGTTMVYEENILYDESGYTRSRVINIDFSDNFTTVTGQGTCLTDNTLACSGPVTLNGTRIDWNTTYDLNGSWEIQLNTNNDTDVKYWTITQSNGVLTLEAGDTRGAGTITGPRITFNYHTSTGTVTGSGVVLSNNQIRGKLEMPSKEIQSWSGERMSGDDGGDTGTGCFIGHLF